MKKNFEYRNQWYRMANAVVSLSLCLLLTGSCMDYGPMEEEDFSGFPATDGVFIANEGNFMYGNASLSYYVPSTKEVHNEIFARANGIPLGDVAQSMTIHEGSGYVVVNNSGIIYAIDTGTFRVTGTIGPMTSPRYIHFISGEKAYVTQLWDSRIAVVNPGTSAITGYIDTGGKQGNGSTEQMVRHGRYAFTNCWSYDNRILVIDTETDTVTDEIVVGIQPVSLEIDRYGMLWVLTDGGGEGNPYGYEPPTLCRIDSETRIIQKRFEFSLGDSPRGLCMNAARDTIYFINDDIWRMEVTDERLPAHPFVKGGGALYRSLGVDPATSEVYAADAIDYIQPGMVYRYSPDGVLTDSFRVGITPAAFCFK